MNVAGVLLIVVIVTCVLVVWFLFALWLGTLIGSAFASGTDDLDEEHGRE